EYDVLAFVENTTAARALEAGRRPPSPKRDLAPTAVNLALAGNSDVPDGWDWSGSRRAHAQRLAPTEELSPRRGRSVSIARASAPWRWGQGQLEQTFSAEAWRGKRLRFSGAVRAEVQGLGNGAQLYVAVRPKPPEGTPWTMPPTAMGMIERPVRSPHWTRHAAEIDVSEDAAAIVIGIVLAGNGVAWFGDFELECD